MYNSLNDAWKTRFDEPGLPEDGHYIGTIESAKFKFSDKKATEWIELKIRVDEGVYHGEIVEKLIFYWDPEKKDNRGVKELTTLMDRMEPSIAQMDDPVAAMERFVKESPGRKVSFEQKTNSFNGRRYKNIWIHDFPTHTQPKLPINDLPPLTDDIPF